MENENYELENLLENAEFEPAGSLFDRMMEIGLPEDGGLEEE